MITIQDFIQSNRERFLSEWASLIRIPSVSCQPEHKADMLRCAEQWKQLLLGLAVRKRRLCHPRAIRLFMPNTA